MRRRMFAVVGYANLEQGERYYQLAVELGKELVENGYRVMTGGLGGVMEAALLGAKQAANYREGDTVAILPSFDASEANPYADIVIASGTDIYRNGMIANADAVVAIGGGAGTLSELSYAWHLRRLMIAYRNVEGWSAALADRRLDGRIRCEDADDRIFGVESAQEVVNLLKERLSLYQTRPPRL